MRRITITLAALALAGAARAAPVDDVQALAWMAGSWTYKAENLTMRETWLAPLEGAMSGVAQTSYHGRKTTFDFASITAEPAGATFTARVSNQRPTPFVLKPGGPDEAVFENLDHDFPQRVTYRRCGEDLCARIEGVVKGKLKSQEWRYVRER